MLYVEELIAPGVVNTMPEDTLRAFADHGEVGRVDGRRARAPPSRSCARPRRAGVDLAAVTAQLEREGVQSFCASYQQLLDRIETRTRDTILSS